MLITHAAFENPCPTTQKRQVTLLHLEKNILKSENSHTYDTRCYFNVRLKANMSQLNLPHGTDN